VAADNLQFQQALDGSRPGPAEVDQGDERPQSNSASMRSTRFARPARCWRSISTNGPGKRWPAWSPPPSAPCLSSRARKRSSQEVGKWGRPREGRDRRHLVEGPCVSLMQIRFGCEAPRGHRAASASRPPSAVVGHDRDGRLGRPRRRRTGRFRRPPASRKTGGQDAKIHTVVGERFQACQTAVTGVVTRAGEDRNRPPTRQRRRRPHCGTPHRAKRSLRPAEDEEPFTPACNLTLEKPDKAAFVERSRRRAAV